MAFGRLVLLFFVISLVFAGVNQVSYAQSVDTKAYSVIETTKVILTYTNEQISQGNTVYAEEYSKIASAQFAHNLLPLRDLNADTTDEIHLLLLDLPSIISSNQQEASSIIEQILNLLDTCSRVSKLVSCKNLCSDSTKSIFAK